MIYTLYIREKKLVEGVFKYQYVEIKKYIKIEKIVRRLDIIEKFNN